MAIRIASYNLWNGAADTYNRLIDFVKNQKFDVLCLQEINGWQDNDFARLKDFADRTGYTTYEYGNSNSEYKLVTFTNLPVKVRTVHVEGFWHCAVEIHVDFESQELAIVNVHLDPWKEDPRLREVTRLLQLIDVNKPTIITGDFNSVSRADSYSQEFLAELQKHKFDKFGQDELDFRVTDFMAAAGFADMAAQLQHMDTTAPSSYGKTNAYNEEAPVSEAPTRVDYAFANTAAASFVSDLQVIKNQETERISDHYPLVLTLGTEPPVEEPAKGELGVPQAPIAEAEPKPEPQSEEDEPKNSPTEGEIRLH